VSEIDEQVGITICNFIRRKIKEGWHPTTHAAAACL